MAENEGQKKHTIKNTASQIKRANTNTMNNASGDQFADNNQESTMDNTANQLMQDSQQKLQNVKETPQKVRNSVDSAKKTYNNIKEVPNNVKKGYNNLKNLPSKIKQLGKSALNTVKSVGNAIRHPIQSLKKLPKAIGSVLNPKKLLNKLNPVTKIKNFVKKQIKRIKKTIKAIKKVIKTIQKVIKFTIKAIKAAIKIGIKLIKLAIKLIIMLIQLIIATWPIWLILLVLGCIVGVIWWFLDNDSTSDNKSFSSEKTEYNGTTIDSDGNATLVTISGNTKIVEAFYQYFAEKSIWVVYDGVVYNDDKIEHDDILGNVYTPLQRNTDEFNDKFMNENGEVILTDYYNRESMFYVNPNALFVYDKYLHGEQIRFPEQIVQHVAYDYNPSSLNGQEINETNDKNALTQFNDSGKYNSDYNRFILKQLTDEDRILNITSQKYKQVTVTDAEVSEDFKNDSRNDGTTLIYIPDGTEKTEGVWDYGLGSILHYIKYIVKHENRGIYENFQVWDQTMQMDENGLLYYGEKKNFATYEEYDEDTNHDNYDAIDIASLEGDARLVTYTQNNAPTDFMKQQLADEETFFIDWVVTASGDVSNHVVYEWKDSGEKFSEFTPFEKEVTRYDEYLTTIHTTKHITVPCGEKVRVETGKIYNRPFRINVDDIPTQHIEYSYVGGISCNDPKCTGHEVTYTYTEEKIQVNERKLTVVFDAEVNGTTWNKEPYYDGAPSMKDISGRRYYEDYLTHYNTFVPYGVSGFLNTDNMLQRIQLNVTDPDLEEELTKILERSSMIGGNNSLNDSGGYTLGSGSNSFEQLYNGSAKEVIDRIWDGLISWGYTPEQAAGVLGNMYRESTYDSTAINSDSGASGLCQWLGGRLDQLKSFSSNANNVDWTDLNSQIQFACMELDNNRYQWASYQWSSHETEHNTFMTSTDPSEIALAMMQGWERSGETPDSKSAMIRMEVASFAYAVLKDRNIEYPIDIISPSTEGTYNSGTGSSSGNIFTSIWNWLKGVGDTIKKGINYLFGFEDEYYDIMTQKERYALNYHAVQESDVDYLLQSIFAYTDNTVISSYYGKITDEFFFERFTDLFSNPIGTKWSSVNANNSNTSMLSSYLSIRQENYPNGFQKPVEECQLGSSTSDYGLYLKVTDGENVFAVCDGTIINIGEDERYGGKYLIIDNGVSETILGSLKDIHVSKGQGVNKGDIIATVEGDELFYGITNEYKAIINPSFVLSNLISDGTLGSEIVAYACQFEGGKYVYGAKWNGEIPYTATDCSGFVEGVFRHFGISVPSGSKNQATLGIPITESELLPGDYICYAKSSGVHHVALYIGNGQVIHAFNSQRGIIISSMNYSTDTKYCRRVLGQ